jgi:16S rRNA (cytidine1402-2'-O)-methyltransferase
MELSGGLYLIPTPIGNLEDLSPRAISWMEQMDILLAEDTRTSGFLLAHAGIKKGLSAFHMHNEHKQLERFLKELRSGKRVGLMSDAGTPGISDPGYLLVRAAVEEGISVSCLPGPTALIPALVVSGFPTDRFAFEGFLPAKKGRQKRWESLKNETRTVVFYESPHRIAKFLEEVCDHLGKDFPVVICRELSKKFEEILRGTSESLLERVSEKPLKGELVVVIPAPAR